MPKEVSREEIRTWRKLRGEGKSYKSIGKKTEWDPRTVKRHLESDIRSSEVEEIRRQLFKERLGKHWDMLLDRVLQDLDPIAVVNSKDQIRFIESSGIQERILSGARIERDDKWHFTVGLEARRSEVWSLLIEHMPKDPLWKAVSAWEEGLRLDLIARRRLYLRIEDDLKKATKLPVESWNPPKAALTSEAANLVYERTMNLTLDPAILESLEVKVVEPEPGNFLVGAKYVAHAPGQRQVIEGALGEGVSKSYKSPEATRWKKAHDEHVRTTGELKSVVSHLRLLPYLPGVCSVCGRVEV